MKSSYRIFVCLSFISIGLTHSLFAESSIYQDHGFSFQHSEAEKVSVTGDKIKTVRIENGNNCLFMIQNYGSSITPNALREKIIQSLTKKYDENAVYLQHTSVNRIIFEKIRTGECVLFTKNNIPSQAQIFTFKKDNDTICVITQMALQHSKEAEQMFQTIQQSIIITN